MPRSNWPWIAASWIATIAGLAIWLARTPNANLRDFLRHGQFWALEIQFWALVVLTAINVPRLLRSLQLRARDLVFPLGASLVALLLVTGVAPRTNRIYYDEQIYQGIGQNLTDLRLAQMCDEGTVEYGMLSCGRGQYNKQPFGYPYLLSVADRVFGVREGNAFVVNAAAAALGVMIVFLGGTALTGRTDVGRYAAVISALIPDQLRWSHTAAAEPTAALTCVLAVLAALAFVRDRSAPALLWMVVATVFAVQFRPESVLIVPVVAVITAAYAPGELARPRFWWMWLLGVWLAALHVGHLAAVQHEGWGTTGDRLSVAFVAANLRTNGWFFLGDSRFPVLYTLLAVAGVLMSRLSRGTIVAWLYFSLFWGIFLFFYAGSYSYGADDRFSLMAYPPLAILAGVGVWKVVERLAALERLAPGWRQGVVIAALGVQFLWYMPFVRSIGEEAWGARADVAFSRDAATRLPRNAIVLTHNPGMWHLWGQSAAQTYLGAADPGYVERVLAPRYAGGVFFMWNYWCNVADPAQQALCQDLLKRFPHDLVHEYRERDYRYALYRLVVPTPGAPGRGTGVFRRTDR